MKYMAKAPGGTAYELTREELLMPAVIQQLKIDESWMVKVGEEWVSLGTFLSLNSDQLVARTPSRTVGGNDDLFSVNARWTPGSVLCLVMRIIGFYFLTQVVQGLVSFITSLFGPGSFSFRLWLGPFLSLALYLGIGLYLLMGARGLIGLAFRGDRRSGG